MGRGLDLGLPGEEDARRQEVRRWLSEHPDPSPRQLAESGYVAPHWPKPWGLGADPVHQLIIDEELKRAGVKRPSNQIGIGWAGPTLIHAGSTEQCERYLLPLLAAEEIWCQLFSEPGAGSDLANLGTRAVRDGDEWVVNGQKIWTSLAHFSRFGILIARTDPDAPKHKGVSYFICPMDAPGVEIRPIVEMTGQHTFNEVFLTDVRLPASNLVGEVNDGWRLAKVTLANERVSLSGGGLIWGQGPTTDDLVDAVRAGGGAPTAVLRDRIVQAWAKAEVLDLVRRRTLAAQIAGKEPGPEASVRKAMADDLGQEVTNIAIDLAGSHGMLAESGPFGEGPSFWPYGFLFAQALTIGGGTFAVQRNIIGERVLGLPHEPDVEVGLTWSEAQKRVPR